MVLDCGGRLYSVLYYEYKICREIEKVKELFSVVKVLRHYYSCSRSCKHRTITLWHGVVTSLPQQCSRSINICAL